MKLASKRVTELFRLAEIGPVCAMKCSRDEIKTLLRTIDVKHSYKLADTFYYIRLEWVEVKLDKFIL